MISTISRNSSQAQSIFSSASHTVNMIKLYRSLPTHIGIGADFRDHPPLFPVLVILQPSEIKTPPTQAPFSSATAEIGRHSHAPAKEKSKFLSFLPVREHQNRSHPIASLTFNTSIDPPHTDLVPNCTRGQ